MLYQAVGDLLLKRAGYALRLPYLVCGDVDDVALFGDVASDSYKTTEFSQSQGQMPAPARPSLRLLDYLCNALFCEMRYLAVFRNFLGDKTNQLYAVLRGIWHIGFHVSFITITTDSGAKGRMHTAVLQAVLVPRSVNGIQVAVSSAKERVIITGINRRDKTDKINTTDGSFLKVTILKPPLTPYS